MGVTAWWGARRAGGHGVVGMLHNGEGMLLLIRADLVALPITTATGLSYVSNVTVKTIIKRMLTSFLTACALFCGSAGAADKPHIVIILVDDMVYGDPGCYNSDSKIPTPNIDSLARAGMRFTDAHSPGALCHKTKSAFVLAAWAIIGS